MKAFRFLIAVIAVFAAVSTSVWAAPQDIAVVVDDSRFYPEDPVIVEDGRTYIPVRFISEHMGAAVTWHQDTQTVEVNSEHGDELVFGVDQVFLQWNGKDVLLDAIPVVRNGRMYLPARHVGEFLHMRVNWDDEQNVLTLSPQPLYEVKEGDTVQSVSKQFAVAPKLLKERNELADNQLKPGQQLKTVIPVIMEQPGSKEDLMLLAKIIYVEAGHEPLKGQIAVGEVVLNRVKDPRFPDTITEVIYQPGQFPPALNGTLDEVQPSDEAILAAQRAMAGESYAKGALYFFNPKRQGDSYAKNFDYVTDIGNHRFVK